MVKAASNNALTVMGVQAVDDTGKYVPVSSNLEHPVKDSIISSSGRRTVKGNSPCDGLLLMHSLAGRCDVWKSANRTYGSEKISFTSALAREECAKYANEVYGAEWQQIYQAALRKEIKIE